MSQSASSGREEEQERSRPPNPQGEVAAPGSLESIFGQELGPGERSYLEGLVRLPLEHLEAEPGRLGSRAEALQKQVTELSVSRYGFFVSSVESVVRTHNAAAEMQARSESMAQGLAGLSLRCQEFSGLAQALHEQQHANQALASNQHSLLEFLEIPQLMDACIRNGQFDEALDLQQTVQGFQESHRHLKIVSLVAAEVAEVLSLALQQLLEELRKPIELTACLKIMGVIRRMGVFSTSELRRKFLDCRDHCLNELIRGAAASVTLGSAGGFGSDSAAPSVEPSASQGPQPVQNQEQLASRRRQQRSLFAYTVLSKTLDITRVQLFQIVTQYRAIFVDDEEGPAPLDPELSDPDSGLLSYWISHRVRLLLDAIRTCLRRVSEGKLLSNLLDQCLYCGLSLSRVGADFRGLAASLFESRLKEIVSQAMAGAVSEFEEALERHQLFIPKQTLLDLGIPLSGHLELVEFPSLTAFARGFVEMVNTLRHCALLGVSLSTERLVIKALLALAQSLQDLKLRQLEVDAPSEKALADTPLSRLALAAESSLLTVVVDSLTKLFDKPLECEAEFQDLSIRLKRISRSW